MTGEETLYTGTAEQISSLVEACDFPRDAFVLVERLPQTVVVDAQERNDLLRFARLHDNLDLASATSGRVFHPDFELRWERDAGSKITGVVYLGVDRKLPGLTKREGTLRPEGDAREYYLFGELLGSGRLVEMGIAPLESEEAYYAEVRIPRLLRYPKVGNVRRPYRVKLVVREYNHPVLGRVSRFLDLVAAEDKEEQA